jgi:hypothetical protein
VKKPRNPVSQVGKRVGSRAIKMSVAPKAANEKESITGMMVDRADLCAKMLKELLQRHEKSGLLALHFFKQCTGVSFVKLSEGRQRFLVNQRPRITGRSTSWYFRRDIGTCTRAIGLEEHAN